MYRPGRRGRLSVACALVVAATAFSAATAGAVAPPTTEIAGSPMRVHIGDRGQMQAFMAGRPKGVFFYPESNTGDAGLFLAIPQGGNAPAELRGRVYGFRGGGGPHALALYTPRGQRPVTGTGTAADPYRQVTWFDVADGNGNAVLAVTQTTVYVNGETRFLTQWDVRNATAAPINLKAIAAADFYLDADDRGVGAFAGGPPRYVSNANPVSGRSGGFEETRYAGALPWSGFQSLRHAPEGADAYAGDAQDRIWPLVAGAAQSAAPTLRDTVISALVDSAAAVEWNQFAGARTLAAQETATFAVVTRTAMPGTLALTPPSATSPQGVPVGFVASIADTDGTPIFAGRTLRYTIAGANPTAGQAAIGVDGRATIVDPGGNVGQDTVVAWVDLDGDGAHGGTEPIASAVGSFVDATPPACKVRPTSGAIGGRGRKARPLRVDVTCNDAATVQASARLTLKVGTKRVRVKRGKRRVVRRVDVTRKVNLAPVRKRSVAGKKLRFAIELPAKHAKRYSRKRGSVTVTVRATDAVGNVGVATGKRKLRVVVARRR